ncbi:hypothetical protein Psta_2240 [Pirellula staleyi DSM 6068]|uniref:RiboL-PSP-HEPN domain-containing protein n=1 Tax=Pirellula staleyi (strain ATCC 27377 / DSM 6068 / ICPB 4128) TaxID=530564 RepID=D2R2S1_PIRSD|nr:hypothetical protein [Pirellula staleyi]ADB16911.1 hypothetical protein Psta_2240 [Pirellula staleyi DSM 6068]
MAKQSSGRCKSLKSAYSVFNKGIQTAKRIYGPASKWLEYSHESFSDKSYHPRVAEKVIGLAFLSMVAAWEEFVEEVFLGYMAGATTPDGYAPELMIGKCQNKVHAMQVLGAAVNGDPARALKWSDWPWVSNVAKVHFKYGAPFTSLPKLYLERLKDAQGIRNRVAHNSAKAKKGFKTLVNRLVGETDKSPLPKGMAPGTLLACEPEAGLFPVFTICPIDDYEWPDFFCSYTSLYLEAASLLIPVEH